MSTIIGYVNGLPIEERAGTAHDPSNGQFTSSGGGSGGKPSAHGSKVGASMVKANAALIASGKPDHYGNIPQNHKGDYVSIGGKDKSGKSPVFSNSAHVGHISDHPSGGVNAHHTSNWHVDKSKVTHHTSQHDAITALKESHHEALLRNKEKKPSKHT